MKIWVDADACPGVIKEILYKAANRLKVSTTLVANQWLTIPKSAYINTIQVGQGLDVADTYIVENMDAGDLVITADIPLAADVVKNQGIALNPRGKLYTRDNIKEILSTRNFMEELRSTSQISGGPSALDKKDRQEFANALDRFLNSSR